MTKFRLVLLDFDGTLADGYPGIAAAANAVRAHYGHPPLELDHIKQYVGWGLDHLILNVVPGASVPGDLDRYRQHYAHTMLHGTELLPGVHETVHELARRGYRLGVCSNKRRPYTEILLERLGIMPPIEKVLGPDDVAEHKPAPDMLLAAMEHFQAAPEETLFLGDMDVDIQCGKAAGVQVWTVPTGAMSAADLRQAGADRVLTGLPEVLHALPGFHC